MLYSSLNHLPKSTYLHRFEQNGNNEESIDGTSSFAHSAHFCEEFFGFNLLYSLGSELFVAILENAKCPVNAIKFFLDDINDQFS